MADRVTDPTPEDLAAADACVADIVSNGGAASNTRAPIARAIAKARAEERAKERLRCAWVASTVKPGTGPDMRQAIHRGIVSPEDSE